MDRDKQIKKSAEDNHVPLKGNATPVLVEGTDKYEQCMQAISDAGLLPSAWQQVAMLDYKERSDLLVNFYIKDPNQDTLLLIPQTLIKAVRVYHTEEKTWAEKC